MEGPLAQASTFESQWIAEPVVHHRPKRRTVDNSPLLADQQAGQGMMKP